MEETFTQMLLRFMEERKITRAGLYKDADIDRKLPAKERDCGTACAGTAAFPGRNESIAGGRGLRFVPQHPERLCDFRLHRPEQKDGMGGEPCTESLWAGGYIEQ